MRQPIPLLICLALVVLACASDGDRGPTYTVGDSAGIQIVENLAPAWTPGEAWRVDSNPLFDLSGKDDDQLFQLGRPRLLDDGRLVMFNGGTCEVRFYDGKGELLASSGRCGKGPGEFAEFAGIWPWRGDSLLIVDQLPRRATILSADGALGRTGLIPASGDMPLPFVQGVLGNGALVLGGPRDATVRGSPGIETSQISLGFIRGLDDTPRLLGTYPGPVYEYSEFQGHIIRNTLAFSASTRFATDHERLFVGFPDRYEIQVHGSDGTLQRIMRRAFQPAHVTQDDIDWLLERRLSQVEGAENQRVVRRAYRDLRHADVMPAFGTPIWPGGAKGGPDMLADALGNLWVFEQYRPGEYRNGWTIFSSEGIWLGTVTLPDGLTPSQIGRDFVLGRWTDDEGFVHIRRHRLIKP